MSLTVSRAACRNNDEAAAGRWTLDSTGPDEAWLSAPNLEIHDRGRQRMRFLACATMRTTSDRIAVSILGSSDAPTASTLTCPQRIPHNLCASWRCKLWPVSLSGCYLRSVGLTDSFTARPHAARAVGELARSFAVPTSLSPQRLGSPPARKMWLRA